MQLAHRVSLGGVQLDEIDTRIIIKAVEIGAGKDTVTTAGSAAGDGTRITGKRRDSVEVLVRFSMNIRRNTMEERADVLERINAWAAKGGYLRINYKPNRRLMADEIVTPGEGDLWKRLSEYTITMRAHAIPYFEDDTAQEQQIGGISSGGSGVIALGGSAKTPVSVALENRSGRAIATATVTVGGRQMQFEGLNLGGNETLVIDTDEKGYLRIRIQNGTSWRSAMAARADLSADDFVTEPGDVSISFTAQRACRMTAGWRCRYV